MIQGDDLQAVIDAERRIAEIRKPIKPSDVVDYSLLRGILRGEERRGFEITRSGFKALTVRRSERVRTSGAAGATIL